MLADIEHVKRLVVEAGDRAREGWGAVEAETKADQTLVTCVDRETEQFLADSLEKAYPGYGFVGEEFGRRGPTDAPLWACDPIDGTTNFVFGLPHWCVSVGLLRRGRAVLGVLYLPALGELYWGALGEGAFVNGERLRAPDRDAIGYEDPICLTSNSLKTLNAGALAGRLRCVGSIAAELAATARGSLCATVGLQEGIVDMAAALCLCHEAGCVARHLAGPDLDLGALVEAKRTTDHFVVAPPRLASYLQRTLCPRAQSGGAA